MESNGVRTAKESVCGTTPACVQLAEGMGKTFKTKKSRGKCNSSSLISLWGEGGKMADSSYFFWGGAPGSEHKKKAGIFAIEPPPPPLKNALSNERAPSSANFERRVLSTTPPSPDSPRRLILRSRFLLLLLPQRGQADSGYLDHLEPDAGDVTLGFALAAESREQHFVVLVHEIQTTVVGNWDVRVMRLVFPGQPDFF